MATCTVCQRDRSPYLMNNKLVCLRCDDLLFDIELELEEVERPRTGSNEAVVSVSPKPTTSIKD